MLRAVQQRQTEVTRRRGPWRGREDVEFATLERVHWYNTQRLLDPIGNVALPGFCGHQPRRDNAPGGVHGKTTTQEVHGGRVRRMQDFV